MSVAKSNLDCDSEVFDTRWTFSCDGQCSWKPRERLHFRA